MRAQLLAQREHFVEGPRAAIASGALQGHLAQVIQTLQPRVLGMYWPFRREFNPHHVLADDTLRSALTRALPYCTRAPRRMTYRAWDGEAPGTRDECGIPASAGVEVTPDVVLAPCLGYTRERYRLGYGGGYFDRFLAEYPHVTAVGVAWSVSEIDAGVYTSEPHDRPMMLIVTEAGVV